MQTKSILIAIATLFFSFGISAQTLTGKVTDSENQPIEFANVALYSLSDSALVTGTVTNANGEFMFEKAETKNAFLKISFIGYETQMVPATSGQTVVLKDDSQVLGEVVVKGNLPIIRIKNDALVTTIQNTVLSKAGTGNDVLKRLPSLTGDNGVFSVFGKGQAKIYINNREMRDVSELDNLKSTDIRDVEIVNNPGARYDASVKAVIRINTVPKVGDGFSFDVRSSYYQSQNVDLTEQLNVNYRKNGWDVFGTLGYYQNQWFQDTEIWQKTYVDTLWTQENTLYSKGSSKTLRGITGINYEISPKHYTGFKYTISAFPPNISTMTTNSTVHADDVFYDKWDNVEVKTGNNSPSHRLNAYYNGSFGDLTVDFNSDFYANRMSSNSTIHETSQEHADRTLNSTNDVSNRLFASKLILSYPVLSGQFSAGSEYTNVSREDDYHSLQSIVPSSNTTIREMNNSFFAEYSRSISVLQVGAGLRYENVRSDYFLNGAKSDEQSRKYHQWFPNASLSANIKNVGLQLSYTAKTKRPTYRQLSSNVTYMNRFSLESGNPFLKPSVIHDVTFTSSWKILQVMMSYKNEHDAIIYWIEQMEENPAISILNYQNFDRLPSITAFITVSPKFGIWSSRASAGLMKQWFTVTSNNKSIVLNKPFPMATLYNSFTLPKGLLLTLDMSFQGKGDYQNNRMDINRFTVSTSISKSFFDDRLSVLLKGHNLFPDYKEGQLLFNDKMEWHQTNRYDSRELELTVRYKFNTARSKYKGTGAGASEINRL